MVASSSALVSLSPSHFLSVLFQNPSLLPSCFPILITPFPETNLKFSTMFVFNKKLRPSAVEDSDSDDSFERLSDTEFDVISCSGDETAASESIEAVEKICEDLESQVDNLSLQLGEDDVASDVKKDEEVC